MSLKSEVEKIYLLFKELELTSSDASYSEFQFTELKNRIDALKRHTPVEAQKLYSVYFHLKSDMKLKDFSNWIVPFERFLKKDVKDDDFIIYNKDHFSKDTSKKLPVVIILDHVRSSFNVGSIFRSSEAFNIEKIYLIGYTPDPSNSKTQKTTLGSHQYIEWESSQNINPVIDKLKNQDYQIIAAETTSHAVNLSTPFKQKKIAFVFGNERFGLDSETISLCDETRKVSLDGVKNSLNIANCASIFLYEYQRQNLQSII